MTRLTLTGFLVVSCAVGCYSGSGVPVDANGNPIGADNPGGTAGAGGASAGGSSSAGGGAGQGLGGGSAGSSAEASGLPCDVYQLLVDKCVSCHASPPVGAPVALVRYADLMAKASSDPTKNEAQLSLSRMQSTTSPMPPKPGSPATAAQIAALQSWIAGGLAKGTCGVPATDADGGTGGAGGAGGGTGTGANPYNTPVICTSNTTYSGDNGVTMAPGGACNACHQSRGGEAPTFAVAGTVYPSAHEPDDCIGSAAGSVSVVITDANGKSVTLLVNASGNFTYRAVSFATPYMAKVVSGSNRERVMATPQTNGDCNTCHTQAGTNGAPGRIMAP
jgi:hypothetical protein